MHHTKDTGCSVAVMLYRHWVMSIAMWLLHFTAFVCLIMQVAYAWATSLSEEDAAALLRRLNMAEGVVDYAVEVNAFNHAFQLAQLAAKQRLPDVHLKYAMFLEDSGRFLEAEGEFVIAGRTRKQH